VSGRGRTATLRDWGALILSVTALLAGGAALFADRAAAVQDSPLKERLARIEAHQEDMKAQLDRIEKRLER
jgi:hypothetical protein